MSLPDQLPNIVLAIGALGTSAQALVDASKIGSNGGLSNTGFKHVADAVQKFLPLHVRHGVLKVGQEKNKAAEFTGAPSLLDQLHSNWINGMKLTDQKAAARAALKTDLTPVTAPAFAKAVGLESQGQNLAQLVPKLDGSTKLSTAETNLLGLFDLRLSWVIEEAYQRADQAYRNWAKATSMAVAILLALAGSWSLNGSNITDWTILGPTLIAGLLAAPLAPVSKDLTSALQAGVKAMQFFKR